MIDLTFLNLAGELRTESFISAPILMQKVPAMGNNVSYSIALVIICVMVLVLLWLPDIFKNT
ncbi:MAG: hypothetical protein F6K58_15815 [Symploca sp. SIO2E9]|nr:hypothetical protein [Symploca sp. SIO2E9]